MLMHAMRICTWCCVVALVGCSRSERPAGGVSATATGAVVAVKEGVASNSTPKVAVTSSVHSSTNRSANKPNPETMKAMQERRSEFARKMIAAELQRTEAELEAVTQQISVMDLGLMQTNSAIKEAAKTQDQARQTFEQARMALPGMKELFQKREAAKGRVATLRGRDGNAVGKEVDEAKAEIYQVSCQMNELALMGRTNSQAMVVAQENMQAAEAAYASSLMAIPERVELDKKQQKLMGEFEKLSKRQLDLAKEKK